MGQWDKGSWGKVAGLLAGVLVEDGLAAFEFDSRSSAGVHLWGSVLPVLGFAGIRWHPCFMNLHRLQGQSGDTLQTSLTSSNRSHCHCLLARVTSFESIARKRAVAHLKYRTSIAPAWAFFGSVRALP